MPRIYGTAPVSRAGGIMRTKDLPGNWLFHHEPRWSLQTSQHGGLTARFHCGSNTAMTLYFLSSSLSFCPPFLPSFIPPFFPLSLHFSPCSPHWHLTHRLMPVLLPQPPECQDVRPEFVYLLWNRILKWLDTPELAAKSVSRLVEPVFSVTTANKFLLWPWSEFPERHTPIHSHQGFGSPPPLSSVPMLVRPCIAAHLTASSPGPVCQDPIDVELSDK